MEEAGTPLAADELVKVELPEARCEDGALVAHVLTLDRFGNAGLNVSHEEMAGTGITLGLDRGDRGRAASASWPPTRARSPTWGRAS